MNLNPYRGLYNLGKKLADDVVPGVLKKFGMPEKFAQGAGALAGSFAGTVGAMLGGIAILSAVVVLPHFIAANIALAPMTALLGTLVVGGGFIGGGSLACAASFGAGNKFFKWVYDKIPGPKKPAAAGPNAGADAEPDFGATVSRAPDLAAEGPGATISPARTVAPEPTGAGASITPAALVPEFQTASDRPKPQPETAPAPAPAREWKPFQGVKP